MAQRRGKWFLAGLALVLAVSVWYLLGYSAPPVDPGWQAPAAAHVPEGAIANIGRVRTAFSVRAGPLRFSPVRSARESRRDSPFSRTAAYVVPAVSPKRSR